MCPRASHWGLGILIIEWTTITTKQLMLKMLFSCSFSLVLDSFGNPQGKME
jgi:hypothetical protein